MTKVKITHVGNGGEDHEGILILDENDNIIDEWSCTNKKNAYDLLNEAVRQYEVTNLQDWNRKLENGEMVLI